MCRDKVLGLSLLYLKSNFCPEVVVIKKRSYLHCWDDKSYDIMKLVPAVFVKAAVQLEIKS